MDKFTSGPQQPENTKEKIVIYHQNHFHDRYQDECSALRNIITRGVTPTNQNTEVDLRIYCKPSLTRSLVMRNSTAPRAPREDSTNVVYKFSCMEGHCDGSSTYIGRTSSTLRRRLQFHRNNGSIFQHYTDIHNMKPPLQALIESTEIVHKENQFRKLQIAEAVSITCQRPTINIQQAADFILPSTRPQSSTPQQTHGAPEPATQPPQAANQNPGPTTRSVTRAASLRPTPAANQNSALQTDPRAATLNLSQANPAANDNSAPQINQHP